MKKTLLLFFTLLLTFGIARSKQFDNFTIVYNDDILAEHWDPNGNVPPQPEADYYVDLINSGNIYYRLLPVEGSNPLRYEAPISIIKGDFKIYSKEYWTERGKTGYEQNNYIFGSLHEPTGIYEDQYKELGNPGLNIQFEGGGLWYGCTMTFYPNGNGTNSNPGIIISGGSHNTPAIFIKGEGVADSFTSGYVDFTISTGGVVLPEEQTYDITAEYTDASGNKQTKSMKVTGVSGTLPDITDLKADASNSVTLTASILEAPIYTDPARPDTSTGKADLHATDDVEIVTPGNIYLIGNITGVDWTPANVIKGNLLGEINPGAEDAATTYYWENVPFTGDSRFRFTNMTATSWSQLESSGTQYYPVTNADVTCDNMFDNSSNWYDCTSGASTNAAWAPKDLPVARGAQAPWIYNVFFNLKTKKAAVGWSTITGIEEIETIDNPEADVRGDAYDMLGRCVKRNITLSEASSVLPSGIYVIGGKKILVR